MRQIFPPQSDMDLCRGGELFAFEFQSPWWDDISGEAKLLIRKLLVLDPQLRPSAEKVFEDPWLRDPTCDVHIPSFSANWRKYRLKRKS